MTAPIPRLRVLALVATAVASGSIVLSYGSGVSQLPRPKLIPIQCLHTWDLRKYETDERQPIYKSAAGRNVNVPEYHDCQRLVNPDGKYGPLVVAFASQQLAQLGPRLDTLESAADHKTALVAVELLNRDSISYKPLQIDTGFSCLYVARKNGGWVGKLVHYGYPEPNCDGARDLDHETGVSLTIRPRRTISTDFKAEDYPPVVRWEWDGAHNQQYIGFTCDTVIWCEAGREGFTSAPSLSTDPSWPREVRRTFEIRGWLDEQVLADVSSATSAYPRPGPVRGTVIPHPALRTRTLREFRGHWVPVEFVLLSARNEPYAKKLNFIPSTHATDMLSASNTSTISLCWAPRGTTIPVAPSPCEGVPQSLNCPLSDGPSDGPQWWAKFDAPSRRPVFGCAHYRPHPLSANDGKHTLGTARWRWLDHDETTWIGCPDGCCETRAEA